MALVVEDGSGLPAAESYLSVADFKAYCDARGVSYSAYTDAQIEQALRRGTAYLDATYLACFGGLRMQGRAQALEWPRSGATDVYGYPVASDDVPGEIEKATAEAAIRELASAGTLSADLDPRQTTHEKVGPLEVTYTLTGRQTTTYPAIENALAGLIGRRSMYSGVAVRA